MKYIEPGVPDPCSIWDRLACSSGVRVLTKYRGRHARRSQLGHVSVKAEASWRWYNYVESQVPPGKEVLRLNLDETSVCLFQGSGRGNVFVSKKRRVAQHVPRSVRRRCMTHIGIACEKNDIQPSLPQVLIGNEATFPARAMAALRASCPPNVHLLRRKSAWNNEMVCSWVIKLLGRVLAPHRGRYQPILLLDASRIHLARGVLRACNAAGAWVVFVPACTTWLLQPLDTHCFQRYKAHLRKQYLDACLRATATPLSIEEFLSCVFSAVRTILQGTVWSTSFDANGYGARQQRVSQRVLDALERRGAGGVAAGRPSDAEVALCLPRRTVVPSALLWSPFDRSARAGSPAASTAPSAAGPLTRARARAVAAAVAAAASASSSSSSSSASTRFPAAMASSAPSASSAAPAAVPAVFGRTRSQTRLLRRGA